MSEPYIIEAKDFDSTRQQRHIVPLAAWTTEPTAFVRSGALLIVRDLPKPPTLEEVLTDHWEHTSYGYACNGCVERFVGDGMFADHIKHMADELRKAGFDRV